MRPGTKRVGEGSGLVRSSGRGPPAPPFVDWRGPVRGAVLRVRRLDWIATRATRGGAALVLLAALCPGLGGKLRSSMDFAPDGSSGMGRRLPAWSIQSESSGAGSFEAAVSFAATSTGGLLDG